MNRQRPKGQIGSDLVVLAAWVPSGRDRIASVAPVLRLRAADTGGKGNPATAQAVARWREQVDRAEKKELVTSLHEVFQNTSVVVVAHYSGLSVAQMTDLRRRMKDAGGTVKVAKNRLAKLALEGTDYAHMDGLMKGPTVIAYSDDPVVAPKIAVEFAKTNQNLVIVGGGMGETALDPDGVQSLATLPSLDELRAKIVGMISTPATRVAQVLAAPGGQVARVLKAYADKDQAA